MEQPTMAYNAGAWNDRWYAGDGRSSSPEASQGIDRNHQNEQGRERSEEPQQRPSTDHEQGEGQERASSQEPAGGTGKKRRSRWEPPPSAESDQGGTPEGGGTGSGTKKRKSRWAAEEPNKMYMLGLPFELDPEMQSLNAKYIEINRRLQMNQLFEENAPRSPSPEPIYDNMGIRINTREYRAREKLLQQRQEVLTQMVKRDPRFKPPADYKPPKLSRKLFIPAKDYPGYNFIGLIIGPRGNTQKRMEKETGAKIVIRGKGSVKEGRTHQKRDVKPDPSENEDLHVLVEADTPEALDAAAGMVEKLLQPVEEGRNEHKRAQLRELAALNGTIRDDESCRQCGQLGHRQYCCPEKSTTFKAGVVCAKCGDGGHPTSDCTQPGPVVNKMDGEYQKFLVEVNADGATGLSDSTVGRTVGPTLLLGGPTDNAGLVANNAGLVANNAGLIANNAGLIANNAGMGVVASPGVAPVLTPPGVIKIKDNDDTNLYVGYLPASYDDDALKRLFEPFGTVEMCKVIRDRITGAGKGYGFVKFSDMASANQAALMLNGWKIEDKTLAVRVAGRPPAPDPLFPNARPVLATPPAPWTIPAVPAPPPPPQFNVFGTTQYPLAPPGTVPFTYPPPPPPGVSFTDPSPPPPGFSPPPAPQDGILGPPKIPGSDSSNFPGYQQFPGYYSSGPAVPPWISASVTTTSAAETKNNQVESEYERFMSEMKMQ